MTKRFTIDKDGITVIDNYTDGKMSFAEYTLIENVIMRVQLLFHDIGDVE